MYSIPGRFGTTSASLWTTTVSKPFGAISRAIAATSAEGHETRILGGMRFLYGAGKAKRARILDHTRRRACPGACPRTSVKRRSECSFARPMEFVAPDIYRSAHDAQVLASNVRCFTCAGSQAAYDKGCRSLRQGEL